MIDCVAGELLHKPQLCVLQPEVQCLIFAVCGLDVQVGANGRAAGVTLPLSCSTMLIQHYGLPKSSDSVLLQTAEALGFLAVRKWLSEVAFTLADLLYHQMTKEKGCKRMGPGDNRTMKSCVVTNC